MDQDLRTFLEQHFSAISQQFTETGQQIQGLRTETAEKFENLETEVRQVHAVVGDLRDRVQRTETEVRHVHVIVEDIQDKVQLAAEVITNVNEKLDRHREEVSERSNDLESLVRTSDRALASRVSDLEQKIKLAS